MTQTWHISLAEIRLVTRFFLMKELLFFTLYSTVFVAIISGHIFMITQRRTRNTLSVPSLELFHIVDNENN